MARDKFRRVYLPYCIQRRADGKYLVLNRDYKVLGDDSGQFIVYDKAPGAVKIRPSVLQSLQERFAGQQIDLDVKGRIERLFFYSDSTGDPAAEALAAVEILMR